MQGHPYTYFIILILSLAGPLLLSFDKKVAFYKKWKYVLPAMLPPALFYIMWDIWFTSIGVWGFNQQYICGLQVGGLPVEEILFFFVVPYCCTFIYECIRCYFPFIKSSKPSTIIFIILAALLLPAAIFFHHHTYTFYTFLFTAVFILIYFVFNKYFSSFNCTAFLIAYAIILVPFLVVNGFLTSLPVVMYSHAAIIGIKIFTIPFEDVFYGLLLIMMNIVLFEKLRNAS